MKRYEPSTDEGSCEFCGYMSEASEGEYVLYTDAQATMTPTPTAAARVSGTIKALEWEPDSIAAPLNAISTHNGFCRWVIVFHFTGPNTLVYRLVVGGRAKDFGTLAAAKAAAQADYEARIKSAIIGDGDDPI